MFSLIVLNPKILILAFYLKMVTRTIFNIFGMYLPANAIYNLIWKSPLNPESRKLSVRAHFISPFTQKRNVW